MKFESMPRYTKYLCWYQTEIVKPRSSKFMFLVLVFLSGICFASIKDCSQQEPIMVTKSHITEEQEKLADIFIKHGSTHPLEMAIAVSKTKNPSLMAALAIAETNARPYAVGDSGDSVGAFQIQPKHWGKVPNTATEQALKAERILQDLLRDDRRGSLRSALAKYNGGYRPPKISYRRADRIIKLSKLIRKEINVRSEILHG